ncbi:type II toxin-antitoxin system tRNA(fMet)-specific endonuclease VapC [Roseofilum capinflatum]|uniref:Ribonuclease VapC n=1 Tax=Roseofilum capinflatum BLCC-M114 TaxID=3022440 RepID=A0ABT7B311_9CYAN|nr:type II toxin-antitoxin system VapC family toxin [Roseofilum capinflatum]MDJ1173562.1 type II toxin-antitoxin system VapC family toxin [Roseofilum capinflatum BLCC-M114]
MRFLLDTNICIYAIKQKPLIVKERLQKVNTGDVGISIITLAELEYGAAKSQNPQRNRETLTRFCSPFQIVDFCPEDAQKFGQIRATLEQQGEPIGSYDLLIAAQAVNRGVTLVTNNIREFSWVEGLSLENWVEESLS